MRTEKISFLLLEQEFAASDFDKQAYMPNQEYYNDIKGAIAYEMHISRSKQNPQKTL